MNDFDRRWQACAALARRCQAPPPEPSPGFVTRVLARRQSAAQRPPMGWLWERLAWRALAAVTALVLVMAALDYRDRPAGGLPVPRLERTVAATFWML